MAQSELTAYLSGMLTQLTQEIISQTPTSDPTPSLYGICVEPFYDKNNNNEPAVAIMVQSQNDKSIIPKWFSDGIKDKCYDFHEAPKS